MDHIAVAAAQRRFDLLAIASADGVTPCGAGRQGLAEFSPGLPILLVDVDRPGTVVEVNLKDLLPGAFTFSRGEKAREPRNTRNTRK